MATHKIVYEKLLKHWPHLLEFFEDIIYRQSQSFSETTQHTAATILDFMRDKFALALLHFYLDVLDTLTTESKIFQKSGSSIIGSRESKHRMEVTFFQIKIQNGFNLKQFMMLCSCHKDLKDAQKFLDGKVPM